MMPTILIVLAAMLVAVVLWRRVAGRRRDSDRAVPFLMKIPVPWVFMLAYLACVGLQRLKPMRLTAPDVTNVSRVAGFVLLGAGMVIAFSALGIFKKRSTTTVPFETPTTLVTSGPYRFSRNPMYLGLTLIYVGVDATRGEIWPLIVLPLLLGYVNYVVIPVEERRLQEIFGESYQQYRARVRRWL